MGPVYLCAFTVLACGKVIFVTKVYSVSPGIFLINHSTEFEASIN